jgi:hypothetical protein
MYMVGNGVLAAMASIASTCARWRSNDSSETGMWFSLQAQTSRAPIRCGACRRLGKIEITLHSVAAAKNAHADPGLSPPRRPGSPIGFEPNHVLRVGRALREARFGSYLDLMMAGY